MHHRPALSHVNGRLTLRFFFAFRTLNPPPLTIPKDTSKLKKHLSLVCDRLGKGAKLSATSSPGDENATLEEEDEEDEEEDEERKENNAPVITSGKRVKGGKKKSGMGAGGDAELEGEGGGGEGELGVEEDGTDKPFPSLASRGKGLPPIGGKGLPPLKGGGGGGEKGGRRGKSGNDYGDDSAAEMV